ncbi:hypothetical protein JFK97_05930 [Chromobacterium phragmitis]|uniref:hypothetical protein n=1 Tax=Chromobacterium amazonense TaxID=1382803 RepID=UPI0021B8112A|nr:hypothetical protein [Chromobacterium amazonense]MBM2883924.1 hypothetical protein [Chromobacterium amazonense]MDE1711841.1 hypothetical protein [Chromobacterium amazonense]
MAAFRIRIKDGRTIGGYSYDHAKRNIRPGVYEARWGEISVSIDGSSSMESALTVLGAIAGQDAHHGTLTIFAREYTLDLDGFPNVSGTSSIEVLERL